jgi:hypothetical protein
MSKGPASRDRDGSAGRRQGRNTTFATKAYREDGAFDPLRPEDLADGEATGAAQVDPNLEGYHAPTAMFDKGQFLGELAELAAAPDTKAQVEAEPAPPKGCRLIAVAGPELGIEWAFKDPEIVLGRDEDCGVHMPDIAVSRRHARIFLEDGVFVLQDLGSGNGTYLNGARVVREVLSPGDEIIIGERTFRFLELNEAPPTAAAHPIPKPLPSEPEVGEVDPDDAESFVPLGRRSQIDVGVVKKAGEPAPSLEADPAGRPEPRPRSALKAVTRAVGAAAALAALVLVGVLVYARFFRGESAAERATRVRREFLQGIELVKVRRFGDARLLFDRVLEAEPAHGRAKEYRAHAAGEVEVYEKLEAARALATARRFAEALEAIGAVPEDSAYATDAAELARAWRAALADGLVADARAKAAARELDAAIALLEQALAGAPEHVAAKQLKAELAAPAPAVSSSPQAPRKPRFVVPPQLSRAVALYQEGQLAAAIDAAEAAGGADAKAFVAQVERVRVLLQEANAAHKKKAAGELLRIAPAALELDRELAGGEGQLRAKLQTVYADGLYLKGIEAYAEADDVRAFKLLSQALQVSPGHKLAETRLAELTGKARDIYYEGYALKDQNAAETRKIFRRLTQMTRPDNPYHKLAAKWLAAHGG